MRKIIWWIAFIFLALYLHAQYKREQKYIESEKECIKSAIGYDDMQECFKLMDRNKAIRENR